MAVPERRRFPRASVELNTHMVASGGHVMPADADNISMGGVQVNCDAATALRVAPRGHATARGDRADFDMRLALQDEESEWLGVRCRVVFCHRVAQHDYRLGVEFLDLDTERSRRLEQFIARRLKWD